MPDHPDSHPALELDPLALAASLPRPIAFVDLETTGANAQHDRITEIGVVEVGPDGIVEWETLVDPGTPIPPFIQRLTGIHDEMVRGKPSFDSLAEGLAERLHGKLFVAHNARFDYGFLKSEFRRAGVDFRADVLCTVRLSRSLFPTAARHGLDALIGRFGLQPKGRHRALADAELLWQFWQHIHAQYSPALVDTAVRSLVKHGSLPPGLEEDALDGIPDRPGVYLFYGDQPMPLYIGKSIHLRQRISAHFSNDHRDAKDASLSRAIRRLEWRETGGEIGALLLEARLIKTLQPLHNQRLRRNARLYSWEMPPGLAAPRLRSDRDTDFSRPSALYGAFPSRAAAESALRALAQEHGLCESTLRLERHKRAGTPCFAHQLQRCAGACVGKEPAAEHRARTESALASMALRPWPFPGPMAWREGRGARHPWHVLENWCYLGSAPTLAATPDLLGRHASFDLDTYQILLPHLDVLLAEARPLPRGREFVLEAPQATLAPTPAHGEAVTGAADRTVSAGRARRRRQADTLPLPFSD